MTGKCSEDCAKYHVRCHPQNDDETTDDCVAFEAKKLKDKFMEKSLAERKLIAYMVLGQAFMKSQREEE